MRVFAGPNDSGKSSIIKEIKKIAYGLFFSFWLNI